MRAALAFQQLVRRWQAPPPCNKVPMPTDDLVMTQDARIRSTLTELAALRRVVSLHAPDGRSMAHGVLTGDGLRRVEIRLDPAEFACPETVNAVVSGPNGLLMFSLVDCTPAGRDLLLAPLPRQMIHVQSRRHFRLRVASGARPGLALAWREAGICLQVRDLSEEGVGLTGPAGGQSPPWPTGPAELQLGAMRLAVPALEIVHQRHDQRGAEGGSSSLGARLLGMGEEQTRALRRWLASTQASELR